MTWLGILVACVMFALIVQTLVRSYGERPPANPRIAVDPDGEGWLSVDGVAELLDTEADEVMNLVERGGIPFYVVPGSNRSNPETYRFQRQEIDDWVIG